ncbi:putative Alpha-1,4 glucan phosphorylase [Cocos nucifera]|uniref:Alpha-1,4 glucan phosphorylase n=1 Tax=Cocos nucifera TaxID=13894 RepID=A0A8K0ICL1_COCNU|nr:putative Alpha-1,4 glucan phosphorylase [Cocos nucifera]
MASSSLLLNRSTILFHPSSFIRSRDLRSRSTGRSNLFLTKLGGYPRASRPPTVRSVASDREVKDPVSEEGNLDPVHGFLNITKDGQEEVAESWLEMGNPWEIVRNDVTYPVKFYGKVVVGSDGRKHWIGGENIKAVAYDVPIPGYKTKTTINLRLWSTKVPSQEFDLQAFNAGEHAKANEAHANAEKLMTLIQGLLENYRVGDESMEGKILRLKQQYTLCSASLQDIIACFERRSGKSVNWEEFPTKVAVQMNDTHPTLCIPELMRILIDVKGLSWKEAWNITQSPDAMFDIQVKRIHEYKRQLLNVLGIVYRYKKMKEMSAKKRISSFVPRVCIFGGKAFATYVQAKRIVKFITDVGTTINHDPDIGNLLKFLLLMNSLNDEPVFSIKFEMLVVFVPDYNVSVAEMLIPASELSQHIRKKFQTFGYDRTKENFPVKFVYQMQAIDTAGMEASGTSNMKFAMNGCVLIGTLDGANVEIRQEVGEDNFFLFGARAHEIAGLRKERAEGKFVPDPRFEEVKKFVRDGAFGSYNYDELIGSLEGNEGFGRADYFLVGKDFPSYLECQQKVDEAYHDQKRWTKMSILNTAGSYKFSSDRTIHEYARDIWDIKPVVLP